MKNIKITNQDLYNERVLEVEANVTYNSEMKGFSGEVIIDEGLDDFTKAWVEQHGAIKVWVGQHGAHDFEEEYGFILIDE